MAAVSPFGFSFSRSLTSASSDGICDPVSSQFLDEVVVATNKQSLHIDDTVLVARMIFFCGVSHSPQIFPRRRASLSVQNTSWLTLAAQPASTTIRNIIYCD